MELDHPVFDCDNHYYESHDAFSRHVPKEWQQRCVQWCEIDGRSYHVIGGRVSHAVANPTWDPIAKPGALHDYFRGNPDGRSPLDMLKDREPLPDCYINSDARVAKMDEQGVESIWLFPTLGVLYEELLKEDIEAVGVLFTAFNRWLAEDWGLHHHDRIYGAPYIALGDVSHTICELEWAIEGGARIVCTRPAAVLTRDGYKSPVDPHFDPFWALLDESGLTLVVHAGDSGYSTQGYAEDGFGAGFGGSGRYMPSIKAFNIERAAHDWLITMSLGNMYTRFPNLRIASVENGSDFLGPMFRKLHQQKSKTPGYFDEDPVELFRENVWMNPFWEDDVYEVVELMGDDHVIFGSDWPHIEGMPQPLDYLVELKDFDTVTTRKITYDNVTGLNTPRPT